MAYIDEGKALPSFSRIGTPTSSYLWRNVMRPVVAWAGDACDMIGMGDSRNFPTLARPTPTPSSAAFCFALWKELGSIRMLCLCCTIGVPS